MDCRLHRSGWRPAHPDFRAQEGCRRLSRDGQGGREQGHSHAANKSRTVAEAADDWLKYVELEKRERSTLDHYRNHVKNHINPRLGSEKVAKLTTPRVQAFRDDLLASLSRAHAKKVLTSLKSLLKDAQRRGNVAQNVALGVSIKRDNRTKLKLNVGVDIPTPNEIKRVVHAATGRVRPFLITVIFTGLRSSENCAACAGSTLI